jgi:hypothetical protein
MESETARLERLYHEMNDEHLQDMAGDPDSLTSAAHAVLNRELLSRGLQAPVTRRPGQEDGTVYREAQTPTAEPELEQGFSPGIPGVFPSSAAIMEQALEPAGEEIDGRARLIALFDGHELSRACQTLEAAGIIPEIESVAGDAMSGAPPRFDIWIPADRLERAESLLRETMGLFPLAEVEGRARPKDAKPLGDADSSRFFEDELITVAELESESEAANVMHLLQQQGIVARLDESRRTEESVYAVQVNAAEQERALSVVASALGVR